MRRAPRKHVTEALAVVVLDRSRSPDPRQHAADTARCLMDDEVPAGVVRDLLGDDAAHQAPDRRDVLRPGHAGRSESGQQHVEDAEGELVPRLAGLELRHGARDIRWYRDGCAAQYATNAWATSTTPSTGSRRCRRASNSVPRSVKPSANCRS